MHLFDIRDEISFQKFTSAIHTSPVSHVFGGILFSIHRIRSEMWYRRGRVFQFEQRRDLSAFAGKSLGMWVISALKIDERSLIDLILSMSKDYS